MALELRPNCEYCDKDLPPNSAEARICTYECTFCADCVEKHPRTSAPTAAADLRPRPIRPAREWRPGLSLAKRPASTKRVRLSYRSRRDRGLRPRPRAHPAARSVEPSGRTYCAGRAVAALACASPTVSRP